MKPALRQLLTLTLLVASALFTTLSTAAEPLPVVASFSILGDLVKVVGGDRVSVTTLVGPDADAHAFTPTPTHYKTLRSARLFVINGLNFEPWAMGLVRASGFQGLTLITGISVPERKMPSESGQKSVADPHAWQDPHNVISYVKMIAISLSNADAAGARSYKKNSETYIKELESLDQFASAEFAALTDKQRQVITSHDAFGYLAARYNIRFFAPQGISSEGEPSAKAVAQLIRQIQRDKIKAVFLENMSNPKLLTQIAQDTGVTLGPKLYVDALSGPNAPGSTYLAMMRYNMTQLVVGMKLNSAK